MSTRRRPKRIVGHKPSLCDLKAAAKTRMTVPADGGRTSRRKQKVVQSAATGSRACEPLPDFDTFFPS